jgi:hypothetical protein
VTADELIQAELILSRFNKLIRELTRGALVRNHFQPWELEILMDMETCALEPRKREQTLRQYQKAVTRQLETGLGPPMKLSEYLQTKRTRRPSTL